MENRLLKSGECYVNESGELAIKNIRKNVINPMSIGSNDIPKIYSYDCRITTPNPITNHIRNVTLLSNQIPSNEKWTNISESMFNAIEAIHSSGHVVKKVPGLNEESGKSFPVISRKY